MGVVAAYRQCSFVVTTRPQSYTGGAKLPGFHEVRIDELEPDAITAFLSHWSSCLFPGDPKMGEEHRQALSEALKARPAIRKMARNPVMLTALAVVHWNERRLPEQRADLYASITTWLVRTIGTEVILANLEWDEIYITEIVRRGMAGDASHPQGAFRLAGFAASG